MTPREARAAIVQQDVRAAQTVDPLRATSVGALPPDVFETLVTALADALVLDYRQAAEAPVASPREKVHPCLSGCLPTPSEEI